MTFKKNDNGKLRFSLLPIAALKGMMRAFLYGAKKYGDGNWRNCEDPDRYYDACIRHLMAWKAGELIDEESGNFHLDHAIASLAMLIGLLEPKP